MDIIWESIFTIGSYDISLMDIVDLSLVTYLLYRLYKLARGTAAINIFFGLIAIYFTFQIVDVLRMKFITQILGGNRRCKTQAIYSAPIIEAVFLILF